MVEPRDPATPSAHALPPSAASAATPATASPLPSSRMAQVPSVHMSVVLDDCWNRIGVQGDRTCERLTDVVHCRNCSVYAHAAMSLLDRPRADGAELADEGPSLRRSASDRHGTSAIRGASGTSGESGASNALGTSNASAISTALRRLPSASVADERHASESVLVFRLGEEWLALPTTALRQVAPMRAVHRVPHRKHPALLGVVNIQGALRLCVALSTLLGVESSPVATRTVQQQRLLVVDVAKPVAGDAATPPAWGSRAFEPVVIPVDEVEGVHRFAISAREALPATVAGKAISHAHAVLRIHERTIGLLDAQVVFDTLERSLR
ncbi:MAG TPA: chemotaxis protein CheW [Pararobbsia sp.]|nr:chemotaxis protein CheW [Pararobbsia sp.]